MDATLARACQDFEAVVLRPMFESFKPTALPAAGEDEADSSGEAGLDGASRTIGSLFCDALAMAFARAGGIGLARELVRTLGSRAR